MAEDEPTTGQRVHRELSLGTDSTISAPAATPELVADATLDLPVADQVASAGALDPGQIIGHFVIRKRLGEGGMGVVLAGEDPDLGRPVAIKVVKDTQQNPAYRDRLLREAKVMARLEHPNIVRVYEVGSDRGRLFVAMELVDGVNLAAWLALERRAWREILAIFQQVGAGLAAVHRAGLVHRDFKPDNVLVDRTGRARVADFGLARLDSTSEPALGASLTRTGMMVGTPAYMAPEQHLGGDVDARADQYSFCISLREALIGSRPVRIEDHHWGEVPRAIRVAIARGASVEPNDRFPSMDALLAALAAGTGRRRVWLGVAAATTLVVAGGAVALASSREAPPPAAPVVVVAARQPDAAAVPIAPPPPMAPAETRASSVASSVPEKRPRPPAKVGDTVVTPLTPVAETEAAKRHNLEGNRHEMVPAHRAAVREALREFGFLGVTLVGDDREADLRELDDKLADAADDFDRGLLRYAMGQAERARDNCPAALAHWAAARKLVLAGTRDLPATQPRRAQAFLFVGRAEISEAYCALLSGRARDVDAKIQKALGGMWLAKDPERGEISLALGIAAYESGDEAQGRSQLLQAARTNAKLRAAVVAYASAVGLSLAP